ncbi:glycogen debranching N-terminal domain-containing protein [Microbacterium sp. Marseille-Q6648]|uniref:MGH1-like glycoside hydrolase domain-containing protein n=1 Tax=Microbacterium sp. Marseille-Q6648 TaxID=2937991 RepID=UPI00203E1AD0|nr:glycogen debranching N-terminal domain-containing protein [Microbacterium sp. Marseille-Q6648]
MTTPLQPLLHDAVVVLRAPVQVWSDRTGTLGDGAIDGVYAGDCRLVRAARIEVGGRTPEHIATGLPGSDRARFDHLLRELDDATPDPGVRLVVHREVDGTGWSESLVLDNRRPITLTTTVAVRITPEQTPMDVVKLGRRGVAASARMDGDAATWSSPDLDAALSATGLEIALDGGDIVLRADVAVPADASITLGWRLDVVDRAPVVGPATGVAPWALPVVDGPDDRLARWVSRALDDLDALRMTAQGGAEQFIAAGAPWFFTLFGRDSLWTARFLLPLGTDLARDTLRVLAGLQGTRMDDLTAQEPGKIMHELRRAGVSLDEDGAELPPLYYGTVDATPLWILLLHDAWEWGLADDDVRALVPTLRGTLAWMRDHGDADGDGLLEYIDRAGTGLANQGWKDSGDSIQWKDGTLAEGPVALAEVQGYAYEAAMAGARLLDAFGDDPAEAETWRAWAEALRGRFHEAFWVQDERGAYPAIALDGGKRPVDTVTSNIGHLLGTGLLDDAQVDEVVARLTDPTMDSGYGLRTMSTASARYWPLSYHGGSVWTHDTAIVIRGMVRAGRAAAAAPLVQGLLRAATAFEFRMPELHSGDGVDDTATPVPYPAACRPQAWSAAAAVEVLAAVTGLRPGADGVRTAPMPGFEGIRVTGLPRAER